MFKLCKRCSKDNTFSNKNCELSNLLLTHPLKASKLSTYGLSTPYCMLPRYLIVESLIDLEFLEIMRFIGL